MEKIGRIVRENAECLLTLAGVILYQLLKGVTEALGIGFAAVLFGVVLTAVGVFMTLKTGKPWKEKGFALLIHAVLWLLKGLIGWVAAVAIAIFIITRLGGQKEKNLRTLDDLPQYLYGPDNACYAKSGKVNIPGYGEAVQYRNESSNGAVSISTIYSYTQQTVTTDAGTFWFNYH